MAIAMTKEHVRQLDVGFFSGVRALGEFLGISKSSAAAGVTKLRPEIAAEFEEMRQALEAERQVSARLAVERDEAHAQAHQLRKDLDSAERADVAAMQQKVDRAVELRDTYKKSMDKAVAQMQKGEIKIRDLSARLELLEGTAMTDRAVLNQYWVDEIKKMLTKGQTVESIASAVGITAETAKMACDIIQFHRKKPGISPKVTKEMGEKIMLLHAEGLSTRKISKALGGAVSYDVVARYVKGAYPAP